MMNSFQTAIAYYLAIGFVGALLGAVIVERPSSDLEAGPARSLLRRSYGLAVLGLAHPVMALWAKRCTTIVRTDVKESAGLDKQVQRAEITAITAIVLSAVLCAVVLFATSIAA